MQYQIILSDPCWSYDDKLDASRTLPYSTLSMDEIVAMPVRQLAAPNAVLLLWVTAPQLEDVFIKRLIGHWGFEYKTVAFVWVKLSKDGVPVIGGGHYSRANAEFVLLAVRGRGVERADAGVNQIVITNESDESITVDQVVFAPRTEHSSKPLEIHRRIERLFGDVTRVELFGRGPAQPGWAIWGDQAENSIVIPDWRKRPQDKLFG